MRGPIVTLAACVAVSGCGAATDKHSVQHARSPVAQAQQTHEYPSSAPPHQRVNGAATTAVGAIDAFATAYINWDADSVSADLRGLAARSVGQARSAMQLAAVQTASDYELQRGGIANSGVVEAVAPLSGRVNEYVVVTRELTTATATTAYQGLQPAWHLAIVTVAESSPGEWVVSGWQPQN